MRAESMSIAQLTQGIEFTITPDTTIVELAEEISKKQPNQFLVRLEPTVVVVSHVGSNQ